MALADCGFKPQVKREGIPMNKENIFVENLRKKYTSLCSLMRPVPWKKGMKWKIQDIFVNIGVSRLDQRKDSSKEGSWTSLNSYAELFTDSELADAKRIVVEGGPGCGKTTLMYQFAYLWCKKLPPMDNIDIFVLLFLRQLKVQMSIFEAVKTFLLPKDLPLKESDIKSILNGKSSVVLALDGLDEYSGMDDQEFECSDVMVSLKGDMLTNVKEIISTRPSCLPNIADCFFERVRLQRFEQRHWKEYIERIYKEESTCGLTLNAIKGQEIFRTLCEIPLFFALLAMVIGANLAKHKTLHFQSVTEVFRYIIMCMKAHHANKKVENSGKTGSGTGIEVIEELAFTGLLRKTKCASWEKESLQFSPNYDVLVDSGILVEEESEVDFATSFLDADLSPVSVRFVHQLFQEWFGACHLSRLCEWELDFQIMLKNINLNELHYLLRFTCGLNPQSAKAILQYLLVVKSFDIFCLCFNEYQGERDLIRDEIEKRCKDLFAFQYLYPNFDATEMHRPMASLLTYASEQNIPVKEVDFGYLSAHDSKIMATSAGVLIEAPLTVEYINILRSRTEELLPWLNWLKECKSLKKLKFTTEEENLDSSLFWEAFGEKNVKVIMIIKAIPAGYLKNRSFGLKEGEWKEAHPYKCNECGDSDIFGTRYRCTSCVMWNLCQSCRQDGVHSEHKFTEFDGFEVREYLRY
ncbi:NLR family CARD domain-containing protein 4 [Holothuria leucospilota]|uniref:NLR family CARD domain-containing protein 4 n=1 Tax=Holothuria leucospilota TaxID=206669 RepID=A0A9Q1BSE8_HOLLE|nr:NLR family CARD domain-containing protein 4 [Holothuria leucospilota]